MCVEQISLGRSRMSRLVATAALALAALGLLLTGPSAEAGKGWCRADPVVIIDGQIADVFGGSTPTILLKTPGPIKVVVKVPVGTKTKLVISDLGFGRGYDFRFAESRDLVKSGGKIPVRVEAYVPARGTKLPVTVYFAPRLLGILSPASADGHTNNWVSVTSSV
ncbi:MAG: hypothetical protein QOF33_2602 [Thermomicrobiales bacterium]|nr:hypothetical protein [Thermomicrobiales bacterium]